MSYGKLKDLKCIIDIIKNFHVVNGEALKITALLILIYFIYLIIDFNIYQKTGKSLHLKIIKKYGGCKIWMK